MPPKPTLCPDLTRTDFNIDLDSPLVHPFLHWFLDSYIYDHLQLYMAPAGPHYQERLHQMYEDIVVLLMLRFEFLNDSHKYNPEAFVAHMKVRSTVMNNISCANV